MSMDKHIINLLLFITILFSNSAFSQQEFNIQQTKFKRVSQAYGYITGQKVTLEKIEAKFPELALRIEKERSSFNSNFMDAELNINEFLREKLKNEYERYTGKVQSTLNDIFKAHDLSFEEAMDYLDDVGKRAKGDIPTPILETLLAFQFQSYPVEEFHVGSKAIFRTKGHNKAKGTDWQISFPRSWRQAESNRPNTIQTFTSEYGDGLEQIILLVKDIELSTPINQVNNYFTDAKLRSFIPDNARFISSKKVTLDNYPGGLVEYELLTERVDVKVKIRFMQYVFIKDEQLYFLFCSVGGRSNDDLEQTMKRFAPLYKLVANSIVVHDQFK